MKKFFALFVALVACSVFAFADGFNAPKSATANFDCKVIAPLTWTIPTTSTDLVDVIAGQTRTFTAVPFTFTLNGEPDKSVTITTHGPVAASAMPTVTLLGGWPETMPNMLSSTGHVDVTYNCTGISSSNPADHGIYQFVISVDAFYTSL